MTKRACNPRTDTGPNAEYSEAHAVQLVGYDLEKGYWLIKNSWGREFASDGFFKVGALHCNEHLGGAVGFEAEHTGQGAAIAA